MSGKLNLYGGKASGKASGKGGRSLTKYLVIGLAIFVVGLAIATAPRPGPASNESGNPFPEYTDNGTKVAFMEFTDFECPYCARAESTVAQLKSEYLGNVNFVFKHFPVHGASAELAAQAAECARDQGAFGGYARYLFSNQKTFSAADLKGAAAAVGLDAEEFASCLDSGRKASIVSADSSLGNAAGVRATPTFFINGIKIEGAQDISVFRKALSSELAKLG